MVATYKLVTVNSAPERAAPLFEKIKADLADQYDIVLAGNAASPDEVTQVVTDTKPDVIFTASMFTEEEAQKAVANAKAVNPSIKSLSLPHGLQKDQGPEAVIAYIKEHLPKVLG